MVHTFESVLVDVVGKYITDNGRMQMNKLINSRVYSDCLTGLISWADKQVDLGRSVSLAPLGVIIVKEKLEAKKKQKQADIELSFAFFRGFVEQYKLTPTMGSIVEDESVTAVRLNLSILAKSLSLDVDVVKMAFAHIFQLIGELIRNGEHLILDFGFAKFVSENRSVHLVFKNFENLPRFEEV